MRNSSILKSVFLPNINEKPKFHGPCGMDRLERKKGKEQRRLRNFILKEKKKKIPVDAFLMKFATY